MKGSWETEWQLVEDMESTEALKKKIMKLINGGYANGNHPERKKMRMKEKKSLTIKAKALRKCEKMGCKT